MILEILTNKDLLTIIHTVIATGSLAILLLFVSLARNLITGGKES